MRSGASAPRVRPERACSGCSRCSTTNGARQYTLRINMSGANLINGRGRGCPLREQVAVFRDVLPDGLRAVAGHVLDVTGKPVVAIVAVQPHHGGDVVLHVRVEP
jgi:hypothetical protein